MTRGGRNLILLGLCAAGIALFTTSISLIIYHHSGDIYLDRSRPGFLPDEQETETEEGTAPNFVLTETGPLTRETIDDYLTNYDSVIEYLNQISDPFSSDPLSDKNLGLD